ncbi:MAG: LamG-like jellyroll fold domain-containing protein [Verrucomicrobiota bacterium]
MKSQNHHLLAAASILLGTTWQARADIIGPYSETDANTVYLLHLDDMSGSTATNSAAGVAASPFDALTVDGNPLTAGTATNLFTLWGATAYSGFGSAVDLSGGDDLAIPVDVTGPTPGTPDALFVASGGVNQDVITISNIMGTDSSFTIEALIKIPNLTTTNRSICQTDNNSANTLRGFQFKINGPNIQLNSIGSFSNNGATATDFAIPTTGDHAFVPDEWFHVAWTYTNAGGAETSSIYWTRVSPSFTQANLLGTTTNEGVDPNWIAPLVFGNEGRNSSTGANMRECLRGAMDEIRVSNVVRSSAQFIFAPIADTDGDGLPDFWEIENGLDPNDNGTIGESSPGAKDGPNGASGDPDADGDSNLEEFNADSDPQDINSTVLDTDADELRDAWEITHFNDLTHDSYGDEDGDLNYNYDEEAADTDPTDDTSFPDGDADGLSTGFENFYDLNDSDSAFPNGAGDDPDGDLYSNLQEQQAKFTDPLVQLSSIDSDADGLVDGWEVKYFFQTNLETTLARFNGSADPDNDRYRNEAEETAETDPNNVAQKPTDIDADGLLDSFENFYFGSLDPNPTDNSNDADGANLLAEQSAGSNPLDTNSTPTDTNANTIPDNAEVFQPYTTDSNTLHLWHLDEIDQAVADIGTDPVELTTMAHGAHLWQPSMGGFKTGLNPSANRGTGKGGVLSAHPLVEGTADNTAIEYMDATTGAFTYEAIVKLGFDPKIAQTSTTAMSIISADGEAAERLFNFRLVPIGHADNNSGGTATQLAFLKIGGGIEQHRVNLPGAGDPNEALQDNWYHVAVTYDGNANTPGNLKLYWTLLDPSRTAANEVLTSQMVADLPTGLQPDFCLGNEGRSFNGDNASNETFLGAIDEVRMSSIARASTGFFLSAGTSGDTDNDSMNDAWETAYGLNVGVDDSAQDLDHDGTNNLVEFRLGLIPNDGKSSFLVVRAASNGALTWPSAEGRTFRIERSTGLESWITLEAAWPAAASPATTTSYTDGSPLLGKAFYRIGLNP